MPRRRPDAPPDKMLTFIGVDAQYFSAVLMPAAREPGRRLVRRADADPRRQGRSEAPEPDEHVVPAGQRREGAEAGRDARAQVQALRRPEESRPSWKPYGLGELVYFGWPIFAVVAVPLTHILHCFYAVVGNYGLAIILLTVLVRGCMFPLSRKQAAGAQKMQELQPEIKKLQEKYKNNAEARAKAQQELFRKHNYNPLSGCLPIFIQLPMFIGLYRSLMVDIELRDAPLFSHSIRWCSNLAAPDMLFDWSGFMPAVVQRGRRHVRPGAVLQPPADPDDRAVHRAAEDVHAAARRRAGRHAAEDDEVHDDLHGRDVLQGGQRPVHLLHRVEPVGPGRAPVPAEDRARRRRHAAETRAEAKARDASTPPRRRGQ